jgi:hypothetical protein
MFAISRLIRKENSGVLSLSFQVGGDWLDEETFTKGYEVVQLGGLTPWHIKQSSIAPGGTEKAWENVTEAVGLLLIRKLMR